jgi:hypothetical protein
MHLGMSLQGAHSALKDAEDARLVYYAAKGAIRSST